jgi:predicted nucleic acid-binding protein
VDEIVCLDAGVWVKALVAENGSEYAIRLVREATAGSRIVAPAFCWAEVGSVLRKKVRSGEISVGESNDAWVDFQSMLIEYFDTPAVRDRAWSLAKQFEQPTLYDTAYLACTELVDGPTRAFWTADEALLAALGNSRPTYVRHLSEVAETG